MSKRIDINVGVLEALAGQEQPKDEFTALLNAGVPDNSEIASAMAEVFANDRKERVKAAAGEIIKLLRVADSVVADNVTSIRNARLIERRAKAKLDRIALARTYGIETNNMLPLVSALSDDENHVVPSSYKPKGKKPLSK